MLGARSLLKETGGVAAEGVENGGFARRLASYKKTICSL